MRPSSLIRNAGHVFNRISNLHSTAKAAAQKEGMLEITSFKFTDQNLAIQEKGHESVRTASHNVMIVNNSSGQKYVAKDMSTAFVGFNQQQIDFEPAEAKEQALLEVMAMKVGGILCPGQFSKSEVAYGFDEKGREKYYVVAPFIPNCMSIRDIRSHHGYEDGDRDESIFFLDRAGDVAKRTQVQIEGKTFAEYLHLSTQMKEMMKKPDHIVEPGLIHGRVGLKLALYVLGENDDIHNRDGNVLLQAFNFQIDSAKKTIIPQMRLIAVDCGLCFRRDTAEEEVVDKAFKLAIREKDSNTMGLELRGGTPTNARNLKNLFLSDLAKVHQSGKIDEIINWAVPHLSASSLSGVGSMKNRLDIGYLASKCIEAGLDSADKKDQALELIESEHKKLQSRTELPERRVSVGRM